MLYGISMKQVAHTVSLTEALNVARTTRNSFNYWQRAGVLRTQYEETTPGVARRLSRKNVFELAIMSYLTSMGTPPKDAHMYIGPCLDSYPKNLPQLLVRRIDDWEWMPFDNMTTQELAENLPPVFDIKYVDDDDPRLYEESAPAYSVINLAELKRQVDDLFDGQVKEADDASD